MVSSLLERYGNSLGKAGIWERRMNQDSSKKADCNQEFETTPETPGEVRLPLLKQLRVDGK